VSIARHSFIRAGQPRTNGCAAPPKPSLGARWGYVPFNAALLARPAASRNVARRLPTTEQARAIMAAADAMGATAGRFGRS
jgi:hypothetical protein